MRCDIPGVDPIVACFCQDGMGNELCAQSEIVNCSLASSLLESEPYPALTIDCGLNIVAANSSARRLLAMAQASLPARAATFVGEEALLRLGALLSSSDSVQTASFRSRGPRRAFGREMHVRINRLKDCAGRTIGATMVLSRAFLEEPGLYANCIPERVETLGMYAAGIVHEFNNLLSVISGRAGIGLVAEQSAAKDRALENVIMVARRAEHVTRNLLTYAQRQRPDFILADLRNPILDAIALIEPECTAGRVEIASRLDELPAVLCDPVQISQVCFNLLRNAREAMPEGGKVEVSLKKKGPWAVLVFSDNGRGIQPEMQARLFEPFVSHGRAQTLKPSGAGLGLFIAKEIVLSHAGEIAVESAVATGSAFTVRLPLLRKV